MVWDSKLMDRSSFADLRQIAKRVQLTNAKGEVHPGECRMTDGGLLFIDGHLSPEVKRVIELGRVRCEEIKEKL